MSPFGTFAEAPEGGSEAAECSKLELGGGREREGSGAWEEEEEATEAGPGEGAASGTGMARLAKLGGRLRGGVTKMLAKASSQMSDIGK